MLTLVEKYVWLFTNDTVITVRGDVHGLGTADLLVQVQEDGLHRQVIMQGEVSIDSATGDVTVTLMQPLTGRVILLG